jgi:DHA1 family bicyclomycin/chloramphenicol resistance-like MFS transporter
MSMTRPVRPKPHPESLAVGALLTALVALGQISTSIYIPSLPFLVDALDTTAGDVNLTLSVFLYGFAVCQLVYGPLSDRFGRRPVLLAGVSLYVAASFACVFATSIEALIMGRFVQGMTACAGPVLGRAIVRDVYGPARSAKAMAFIGMALAVSPAVAPIIGGYMQTWFGWRANFVLLGVIGLSILAAVMALLAETNTHRDPRALRVGRLAGAAGTLLADGRYWGYTLSVGLVFAGLMAFTAGAPFVFIDGLGLPPERFGMLSVFNVLGFLGGSVAAARLTQRLGIDRLLLAGTGLCLAGGVAMAAIAMTGHVSIAGIIAPMMVFALGLGIVLPNGIAGALAPFPRIAGTASALLGFLQMIIAGSASVVVGRFAGASPVAMAAVIALVSAAALAAFTMLVWRSRSGTAPPAPDGPPPSARSEPSGPVGGRHSSA